MTFDQPKSIISIALAYPTRIHEEVPRDEKRGQFARASWGSITMIYSETV